MKFTATFGIAALFLAPSAVAWKLPVSIHTIDPHRYPFLLTLSPSTPTRPQLRLLPVLLLVASLAVFHLEPQVALQVAPQLAPRLDGPPDGLLDSPLTAE